MSDDNNDIDLRHHGRRILGLLRDNRGLTADDLNLVTKIIDRSEARATRVLKLYGVKVLVPVVAIWTVLDYGFGIKNTEINAEIFWIIIVAFVVHFFWVCAGDNCRSSIERRLICQECGRQCTGIIVHKLAKSEQCPKCGVDLKRFFNATHDDCDRTT
jgi:hypothetical protein